MRLANLALVLRAPPRKHTSLRRPVPRMAAAHNASQLSAPVSDRAPQDQISMGGGPGPLLSAAQDVSSVPGFASTDEEYKGTRKLKQRLEYSENSSAGFVELALDRIPSHQQFFKALKSTPDVDRVEWKELKTSQGNVGDHYMEQNLDVWAPGSARPIEVELTRDPHVKEMVGRPFTVSVWFKQPCPHVQRPCEIPQAPS